MEELKRKIERLYDNLEEIKWDLEKANDTLEEIESAEVEIESNTIKDVDKFVFKLKADNLYSPEIQEFLISYMQFYNN